jgi:hypothetical protein
MAQEAHNRADAAAVTAEAPSEREDIALECIDRLRQELESRIARARHYDDGGRLRP